MFGCQVFLNREDQPELTRHRVANFGQHGTPKLISLSNGPATQ